MADNWSQVAAGDEAGGVRSASPMKDWFGCMPLRRAASWHPAARSRCFTTPIVDGWHSTPSQRMFRAGQQLLKADRSGA